jgi:hypothetical protein
MQNQQVMSKQAWIIVGAVILLAAIAIGIALRLKIYAEF